MIKKIILSSILSLITIFSFSILERSCSWNLYKIFSIWLKESNGFHEYSFFLYGFLINFFVLFILYLMILLYFKIKISNKWIFALIMILSGLYVHFVLKTNIRIHMDSRNIFPKEFLEYTIDRKITVFMINKDMQCPD